MRFLVNWLKQETRLFCKENDWLVLLFFPKEHVRTLISKEIKNIIDFLLLKAHRRYRYQCIPLSVNNISSVK